LLEGIQADVGRLSSDHDAIVLEGMGNVAMGACLKMSAADVARSVSARALLVVEAGVGRTIDEILLCSTFIKQQGADFMGVVVSKAWPAKYERISAALTASLADRGIPLFGITPYQEELASPTVTQVFEGLGGELLGGGEHLEHRVARTIIGAMRAENMSRYIGQRTLVITPGDRSDVAMACLRAHMIGGMESLAVSGLVLTCGHAPDPETLAHIKESHLPCMLVDGDTYSVATELRNRVYKITPDDRVRIDWAVRLVSQHVDIDRIIAALLP
jgi:BioD-like phosphotransacetylase family protein